MFTTFMSCIDIKFPIIVILEDRNTSGWTFHQFHRGLYRLQSEYCISMRFDWISREVNVEQLMNDAKSIQFRFESVILMVRMIQCKRLSQVKIKYSTWNSNYTFGRLTRRKELDEYTICIGEKSCIWRRLIAVVCLGHHDREWIWWPLS